MMSIGDGDGANEAEVCFCRRQLLRNKIVDDRKHILYVLSDQTNRAYKKTKHFPSELYKIRDFIIVSFNYKY